MATFKKESLLFILLVILILISSFFGIIVFNITFHHGINGENVFIAIPVFFINILYVLILFFGRIGLFKILRWFLLILFSMLLIYIVSIVLFVDLRNLTIKNVIFLALAIVFYFLNYILFINKSVFLKKSGS